MKAYENILVFAALTALGFLIYSPAFNAPWYFDDLPNIVNNPKTHRFLEDWANFLHTRPLSFFSFHLNYLYSGLDVAPYRIVNIFIHCINAYLVYLIVFRIYKGAAVAYLSAVVFLCHPVQIQAVTYIVQRMASLSCLFILLSFYCFARHCENDQTKLTFGYLRRNAFLYASGVFYLFAVLSKENVVLFPFVLAAYMHYLGGERKPLRGMLFRLAPFFACSGVPLLNNLYDKHIGAMHNLNIGTEAWIVDTSSRYGAVFFEEKTYMPLRYFATQFKVVKLYLEKIFFPVDLHLDYSFPYISSVFDWGLWLGVLLVALLAWMVVRCGDKHVKFWAFFAFLLIIVECSFLPLNPFFEHRLYLPLVGIIIILARWALSLPRVIHSVQIALGVLLLFALSTLTYERNRVWADPVAFWQNDLKIAPHSHRVRLSLSREYILQGRHNEAIAILHEADQLKGDDALIIENLAMAHNEKGQIDQAIAYARRLKGLQEHSFLYEVYSAQKMVHSKQYTDAIALLKPLSEIQRQDYNLNYLMAVAYIESGDTLNAQKYLTRAETLAASFVQWPDSLQALSAKVRSGFSRSAKKIERKLADEGRSKKNLQEYAGFLFAKRDYPAALEHYKEAARLDPSDWRLTYNIALTYYKMDAFEKALTGFEKVLAHKPRLDGAHNYLGIINKNLGRFDEAEKHFLSAIRLAPDRYIYFVNLANLYKETGAFARYADVKERFKDNFPERVTDYFD